MVVLIYNNPLLDDCITGLPIDDSPETRWLRASHNAHQNQTRMGMHEEMPCLQQEIGVATAVQTNQDTGVPPYLKRKLLMRHDGMVSTDSDRTSPTSSCNGNCKASGGKIAILGDTSTVPDDDGDWIHSDYSNGNDDEDEEEAQRQPELGVGVVGPSRNGGFPPRVRWLQRKHLHHLRMTRRRSMAAMKCAPWRHDDDDDAGKVTAVPPVQLARPQQIQDSPPPRSGKRKRNDSETETAIVTSESYNRNSNDLDESTRKRQRLGLGSCHGTSAPAFIQRVEGLGGLPANTDGAPPITITGRLSEASALSVGPRRSQRIREKLGSACVTARMS